MLGLGQVVHEEELEIKVPSGVEEGLVLRVAGKGEPAPQPKGITGDLFVRIVSLVHSVWKISGEKKPFQFSMLCWGPHCASRRGDALQPFACPQALS
jgi:DnaJ-class molecular chaperone